MRSSAAVAAASIAAFLYLLRTHETGRAFAVWPEDNPADARRECLEHWIDQPWRRTSEGVRERFAEEVLGIGDADDIDETLLLIGAEREGLCWYVTHFSEGGLRAHQH